MSDALISALVEAGAILPGEARAGSGQDTVTARRYTHPVLEKTVVRLVGATVGPAEDLSMEFLGFETEAPPATVGHGRRQALGFPAWALVNDPANGRHALALVKDMERLARVAKSKPGNAKEGYDALATRLGGAAPQFLPTFWEQAGRAFLAADNQRMAGTCFTLARRAEQVHGLPIDEERLREVHLEFAFGGALTAKMLTEFARGVVDRQPAAAAYELVRTLAVRRVAGGLAPQVSLADELAKMAKAAKLDPEAEAQSVVGQLITFPAMVRSPMAVWKGYRKALVKLAKQDAKVRARLLEIMPEPPGWRTDGTEEWLDLLEATGAVDLLINESDVSAARWLERLMAHRQRRDVGRSARLLSLVERMVPRLIAEGRPVAVWSDYAWRAELDVVDLCLAKGVPLAGLGTHYFDVHGWGVDEAPGARDLSAIAADESLRPLLAKGVRDAVSRMRHGVGLDTPPLNAPLVSAVFGPAGVAEVYREVLEDLATQASGGTVMSLDELLSELAPLWSASGVTLAPAAFEALRKIDVAAMLSHSLRSGLMEEFTLPGYEEVASQKLNLQLAEGWPALAVYDNRSVHLLKPDGSVVEHVFRYPPAGSVFERSNYSQTYCQPVGDDLLVRWRAQSSTTAGYWFSDPGNVFETTWGSLNPVWGTRGGPALPLPGGGVTRGDRPWHPGDTHPPEHAYTVAGDGVNFWRCEHLARPDGESGWVWREYDPQTGAAGRVSMPSFLARPLPDGATLVPEMCQLRPAPAEFAGSPLGWHDGLIGWRVATLPDGGQHGESIDGRTLEWHASAALIARLGSIPKLLGALRMPGEDTLRPVTSNDYEYGTHVIWTADGRFPNVRCSASTKLPPLEWWHALKPSDPHGSAALRAVGDDLARKLLKAKDNPAKLLPGVTDANLRAAVTRVVEHAVLLRRRLDGVERLLASAGSEAPDLETVNDEILRKAWGGLVGREYHYYYGPGSARRELLPQLRAVGKLLAGNKNGKDTKESDPLPAEIPAWRGLLAGPGALVLRAASPITGDEERRALAGFLSTLAESGLADGGGTLRAVTFHAKEEFAKEDLNTSKVLQAGDQTTLLLGAERNWDSGVEQWLLIGFQRSPSGKFSPPPGMTLREEILPGGWSGGERLLAFTRLLAAQGPPPWRSESVDRLVAATGMTRPEAALMLGGLPGLDGWESNFLTPQQRSTLGVNVSQARVAREGLKDLSFADRVALLDSAMPADPAVLWETGPDVDALARRWIALRGVRVAVPDELVIEAAKVVPKDRVADVLQAIAQPSPGSWLTTDGKTVQQGGYYNYVTSLPEGVPGTPFDGGYAYGAALALVWLAYHLPWGDPIRAALPTALDLARQRLRNPDLLVGYGSYEDNERPPGVGPALVDGQAHYGSTSVSIAPSRLDGPDDPALGFVDERSAFALRILLSPELTATVATPEGAQGDPRDPRVGAPDLVKEAAAKLGVDELAATYYLQLLALPDPTDRNVLACNGWKASQLKAVQKTLTDAGHVLAAKRERAGRPVFLPGGWLSNKPPSPPMETWKASLYQGHGNLTLVTVPVPELFRTAWARVTSGDTPRYHDLKETK